MISNYFSSLDDKNLDTQVRSLETKLAAIKYALNPHDTDDEAYFY